MNQSKDKKIIKTANKLQIKMKKTKTNQIKIKIIKRTLVIQEMKEIL